MNRKIKTFLSLLAIFSFVIVGIDVENGNQSNQNNLVSETVAGWNEVGSTTTSATAFSNLKVQTFLNGFLDVKSYFGSTRSNMFWSNGIANRAGTQWFSNITDHGLYLEEESSMNLIINSWYTDWKASHAEIDPTMYIVELPVWDRREPNWKNCHTYVRDEYNNSFDEYISSEHLVAEIDSQGNSTVYQEIEVLPGEGFTACRLVYANNDSIDLTNFNLEGFDVGINFTDDQFSQFKAATRYRTS